MLKMELWVHKHAYAKLYTMEQVSVAKNARKKDEPKKRRKRKNKEKEHKITTKVLRFRMLLFNGICV